MDFILNLLFQHSNQLAQEVHEVFSPYGSHWPVEQVHCIGGLENQSWVKKALRKARLWIEMTISNNESVKNFNVRIYLSILIKNLYILDWWMGHWRRSVENLSIMRKVFFYLLCMVLILPSVGMTSLRGFFQMFIDEAQSNHTMPTNSTLKWNCIFL